MLAVANGAETKRKFIETVELQVGLKNIDVAREKKFNGAVVLPHRVKTKMTFIVIGDQKHCDEANEKGIPNIDSAGLTKFKKDKKKIKKWGMLAAHCCLCFDLSLFCFLLVLVDVLILILQRNPTTAFWLLTHLCAKFLVSLVHN
jgi:hypothetical protein